ncbi:hypothetical protein HMPREF0765_3866 [Sphingobacterium spiritivorum ATCC 33300]|uniref:Uncharacterized protein n=1 Tax=Sphingobacterium spiritivorum ATCC 33300 TaxID=525372 RepID=C2G2R0_SPHSI|nr:hypothetical protein HMPREF0765_3866 [Sphingobacterium spiritivorum ATCC 33300]
MEAGNFFLFCILTELSGNGTALFFYSSEQNQPADCLGDILYLRLQNVQTNGIQAYNR